MSTGSVKSAEPAQRGVSAAEFVEHFAEGWRVGGPVERFVAHFRPVFSPEVVLKQPLSPPAHGYAGMERQFRALFRAVPDLRAEVHDWGETVQGALIQLTLYGTFGGRPLAWDACDVIVLRDGLVVERRSYFDALALLRDVLTRPRAVLRLLPMLRKEPR